MFNNTRPHPPEILVQVETAGWNEKISYAIDSRNQLKIIIKGYKAGRIQGFASSIYYVPNHLNPFHNNKSPIPYPSLCGCIQMCELIVLSSLLLKASRSGYSIPEVLFKSNSTGTSDDEFFIFLK